ncbi:MAG: PspA/IM30 family protein [Phycisphaerae bacterium]
MERAKKTAAHASAARKRIQQQLEELRSRKEEIITRSRVAKTRQNIQQTVSGAGGGTDSILDAVARLEAGVEEAEAELEIQAAVVGDSTVSPSLEQRLDDLDRDAEIEKRMEQLRKQVGNEQQ